MYSARRECLPRASLACLAALVLLGVRAGVASDRYVPGHDYFFNREHAEAVRWFERLVEEDPRDVRARMLLAKALLSHELGRLGLIGTSAFRGDEAYNSVPKAKRDPQINRSLREAFARARAACERRLQSVPDDREALHVLAQVLALRASFEFLVAKSYLAALASGRRARAASYRVCSLYPEFVDGLLVAGVDEYILGSLPWAARAVIALSGYRGNRKRGAGMIARVASEGQQNRDDARLLLALLHRRERRPAEAAALFRSLADDFPRAYTFALETAAMSEAAGDDQAALAAFREVERKRAGGEDRFERMPARVAAALARHIEKLEDRLADGAGR